VKEFFSIKVLYQVIVFRMLKKGWVTVERFENDRRRLKITLTDEGKNLAQWLEVSQVWNIFILLINLSRKNRRTF